MLISLVRFQATEWPSPLLPVSGAGIKPLPTQGHRIIIFGLEPNLHTLVNFTKIAHRKVSSPHPTDNKEVHGFPLAVCVHGPLKNLKDNMQLRQDKIWVFPEKSLFVWMFNLERP